MPDIFISYSRKDSEQALELAERLRTDGIDVWIDQHALEAADSWSKQIVGAIDTCASFIVLLSHSSIRSENVVKELSIAFEARKRIIPVELEPIELTPDFRYQLAGIQRVALSNYDSICRALGIDCNSKGDIPARHSHSRKQSVHKRTTLSLGKWQWVAAIVVIGVAIVFYFLFTSRPPKFDSSEHSATGRSKTKFLSQNAEANALFEQAILFHSKQTKIDLERAFNLYQAAIAKDSTFALAYADLAVAYISYASWDSTALERATDAALKAILLNSQLPSAFTALATIRAEQGRITEAVENQLKAIQFDSNNPQSWTDLGMLYESTGNLSAAISAYRRATIVDSSYIYPYLDLEVCESVAGNSDSARAIASRAKPLLERTMMYRQDDYFVQLQLVCNESFRTGIPLRQLKDYHQYFAASPVINPQGCLLLAMMFSAQHEVDSAFRWLDMPWIKWKDLHQLESDPVYQNIVRSSRFSELLRRKQ